MNIDSIKNGIVIDHIQAKKGMEIYELLELAKLDCSVAIITNAKSQKMGRKDIIKIDKNINLDVDILGYIDPNGLAVSREEWREDPLGNGGIGADDYWEDVDYLGYYDDSDVLLPDGVLC